MGKYVKVKIPKGAARAFPRETANAVMEAWERAVGRYGEVMADNYMAGILRTAGDTARTAEMKRALADFYRNLLAPKVPALKQEMVPIRQTYKQQRAQEITRAGAPAFQIVEKEVGVAGVR